MFSTVLVGTPASVSSSYSSSFVRLAWKYFTTPVEDATLKIVIITDWHTNPRYNASLGAGCECMLPRPGAKNWVEPSSPWNPDNCALSAPASQYGQYGCDSSPALAKASLRAAAAAMPNPDIVLILGDLVMHDSPSADFDHGVFRSMSRLIREAFPNRPYACQVPLGNNDVFPNYVGILRTQRPVTSPPRATADRVFAPLCGQGIDNSNTTFYASQAAAGREFCGLDHTQGKLFSARGYYSRQLGALERVVILNTNIYASQHAVSRAAQQLGRAYPTRWSDGVRPGRRRLKDYSDVDPSTEPDPLAQFAWLEDQLHWARSSGGRVHISAHIPPTLDSYSREPQWQLPFAVAYWRLVDSFADVLGFQLFGHFHSDEIRSFRSTSAAVKRAPALRILSSVSPIYKSNPAFYTVSMSLRDERRDEIRATMHAFDLANPPADGEPPIFAPLAQRPLDDTVGLGGTNEDYERLFSSMLATPTNASTNAAFDAFFRHYKGGFAGEAACTTKDVIFQECASCTGGCRVSFVCLQMAGRLPAEYNECLREHLQTQ